VFWRRRSSPAYFLVANRAKGDRPVRRCLGWLGNPVIIGGLYVVFAANLLVHGVFVAVAEAIGS
jgi:hypothetical protein